MFLERHCIHTTKLASISIRRKRVIRSRGVVSATTKFILVVSMRIEADEK